MSLLYRRKMLLQRKSEQPKTVGKTTLYTDGTFIINEYIEDRDANIALHGSIRNEYVPLDNRNSYVFSSTTNRLWYRIRTSIRSVEFGSPIKPTSTAYWFDGLTNVRTFNFTNLDMSNVTDMSSMFSGCSVLTSLDLSSFNTSNVTLMRNVFRDNPLLTSIDVSSFDTSKVTNMYCLFYNIPSLQTIDVSNFDTSNVTDMSSMFMYCSSLKHIDLTNFNVNKVTNMDSMFYHLYTNVSIETLNLFSNDTIFNTSVNTSKLFYGLSKATSITIHGITVLRISDSTGLGGRLKEDCNFYVPEELVDDYKSATNWVTRSSYISAI